MSVMAANIKFFCEKYTLLFSVKSRSFGGQQMDFYGFAENLLTNTMALDGKACVQRLICELAEVPIEKRSILGEALHRLVQ